MVDLSWLENTRATSRRREDSRVRDQISRLWQLQRDRGKPKHYTIEEAQGDKQEATVPTAEHDASAGVQAEGAGSPPFSRPLRSSAAPQSSDIPLVDSRLVPARAMLAVGIFNVSCCADRVVAEAASQTSGFCPIQRGSRFEICGRGRKLSGITSPGTESEAKAADSGEVPRTAGGNPRNALTLSWTTRMGGGDSASLSARAKSAITSITTASDVRSVEKTVVCAEASAFLGEIRFSSRQDETKDMVEDRTPGLVREIQPPCLVVSGVSLVPTDAVQRLGLTTGKTLRKPPPMSSPLTEDMEDLPAAGRTGRGCEPSEQTRLATGTTSLPPRLSASFSNDSNFYLKVPEVQCRVEAVQGSVDADMSGWFSLRGYWETQDSTAETRRAESIIAGDEAWLTRPSTITNIPVLRR